MNPTYKEEKSEDALLNLESRYKNMSKRELADQAVNLATLQVMACSDFKAPRLKTISKFYHLYDGHVQKKIRQLFNVPIPVFPGMIDTLNAQYDTGIFLEFEAGDAADYFRHRRLTVLGEWR